MNQSTMKLFNPLTSIDLTHRIVMAPCTRIRGTVAGPDHVNYYTQRASPGGLLITEGSPISAETQYETAAGIYTDQQEEGWKKVVDSVHKKGGKISIQLWHLGRMNHHSWVGGQTVSSSDIAPPGSTRTSDGVKEPYPQPRPLTREEIYGKIVDDYTMAAERAKRCNFDFIEIHGAHGYLVDQFLCDQVNKRTDEFGTQSFENRVRFLSLILQACIKAMGDSKRVAIRISPVYKDTFAYQGCKDSNPNQLYREVVAWLNQFSLGYLLLTEARWNGGKQNWDPRTDPTFNIPLRHTWAKQNYTGLIIGSGGFTPKAAEKAVADGIYDAIAFGRLFIGNPDLPERIRTHSKLNVYQTGLFYTGGLKGYTDYPDLGRTISPAGNYEEMEQDEIASNINTLSKL